VAQWYKLLGRIGTPPQLGCTGSILGASSPLPLQLGAEGFAALPKRELHFFVTATTNNQPTKHACIGHPVFFSITFKRADRRYDFVCMFVDDRMEVVTHHKSGLERVTE
jgi:hypothetical protein